MAFDYAKFIVSGFGTSRSDTVVLTAEDLFNISNKRVDFLGGNDHLSVSGQLKSNKDRINIYNFTMGDGNDKIEMKDIQAAGMPAGESFYSRSSINMRISAGAGDDTVNISSLKGFQADDIIIRISGGLGNDRVNFVADAKGNIHGDSGNDILTGGVSGNTIKGGTGSDTIYGGNGDDILAGGGGNEGEYRSNISIGDYYFGSYYSEVSEYLTVDADESDVIFAGDGNDIINGGQRIDEIILGEGKKIIHFGDLSELGDLISGFDADDVVILDNIFDSVEWDSVGSAEVLSYKRDGEDLNVFVFTDGTPESERLVATLRNYSGDYLSEDQIIIGTHFNRNISVSNYADQETALSMVIDLISGICISGTGDDTIYGASDSNLISGGKGYDLIFGNAGDDSLNGEIGIDTLVGGSGNDTYIVDEFDILIEEEDEGIDTVIARKDQTLFENFEHLFLDGREKINGIGNLLNNKITGNANSNAISGVFGNDTLLGLDGNDTLDGGVGNDLLVGGKGSDILTGSEGDDTLDGGDGIDAASYASSSTGVRVQLGAMHDSVAQDTGGSGIDVLKRIENLIGSNFNDQLLASTIASGVSLSGGAGNDSLFGGTGGDTLDAGTGIDTLVGGAGNDTFVTDGGETIIEAVNAGMDTVQSSVSHSLSENVENLTLTGTEAIAGTGNSLNNLIVGNGGANTLSGGAGDDTLNGGSGADTLVGGAGNDIYVSDGGDTITEAANDGVDAVQSSAAHILSANVENLTLTGTGAINGTGNTLNNVLTGNSGNNVLSGGSGADTLVGGAGNDTYVTDGGDTITEAANAGTDTVQSSVAHTLGTNVENLTLTGASAIAGTGNTLSNQIVGNSAANTIYGATGADTLTGGAGNDTFVFKSVTETTILATTADIITDFVQGQDKINLADVDAFAGTTANDAFVWKGTAAFASTTQGEVRYDKFDNTGTANDYTMVWIDNDNDTVVEMAIRLTGLYNLAASDFIL